jgi:dTDP-4-amino-4,6-dideoxygalactose transaminase
MEGIQGAVLGVKMKHIDYWTECRRNVAARYMELLSGIDELILPAEMPYAKHVYHLFVIQVAKGGKSQRDELAKFLNDNGISTGLHYPVPLHLQKCFDNLGYKKGDFPITEQLAESGISLPMYPELTEDQLSYVTGKIKEFYSKSYNSAANSEELFSNDIKIS